MKKKFIYNLFLTFLCLVLLFFFLQHREQYFIIFLSLTCSLSFLPSSSLSQFFLHSLSNLLERGQLVQHTNNIHISNTPKNVNTCVHTLHMVPKCAVAEPYTQVGGPRPPQNFKKLIYSMYIIYILKNVAYKN